MMKEASEARAIMTQKLKEAVDAVRHAMWHPWYSEYKNEWSLRYSYPYKRPHYFQAPALPTSWKVLRNMGGHVKHTFKIGNQVYSMKAIRHALISMEARPKVQGHNWRPVFTLEFSREGSKLRWEGDPDQSAGYLLGIRQAVEKFRPRMAPHPRSAVNHAHRAATTIQSARRGQLARRTAQKKRFNKGFNKVITELRLAPPRSTFPGGENYRAAKRRFDTLKRQRT